MRKYFDLYFARSFVRSFFDDDIMTTSAALSYYMVFSFFPLLIMISIFLGRLNIDPAMENIINNILPDDVIDVAEKYLEFVNSEGSGNILFASAFFTVYFPVRAVMKLMNGIRRAYNIKRKISFIKRSISLVMYAMAVYIMIVFGIFIISMGDTAVSLLLKMLSLPIYFSDLWRWLKFIILWCISICIILALHYSSSQGKIKLRYMLPGCVISVTVWTVVSALFSFYVKYMGRYSVLYGSIGAVIILLYWFYITSVILLMGAEFSGCLVQRIEELG